MDRVAPKGLAPPIKPKPHIEPQDKLASPRSNGAPLQLKSKAAYSKQMPTSANADPLSEENSSPVQSSKQLSAPRK
jgi:hypothetical protein